jgi:hypothetical protein
MRLGAELDQLRQGAMAQAISQSLREALDLHTWRYGMIANLLAAYHRAQSPQERAAYAALIAPLTEAAQAPEEREMVVPRVGVRVGYLPMTAMGQVLGGGVVQNQPQQQGQQGGSAPSDQLQPAEQQTTAPQTDTTAQPAETWKPTKEQPESTVQPIRQQPVEQPGTQQPQGTLGGILQQQPNQQQFTTPAPPNQQQPEEYKHTEQAMQIPDWSHITQTAIDQVLSIVFPWYSLVKNDPRGRQALSGFLQVDYEKMSKRQQQRP